MKPKIIVITGPTATGKTRLGIALAKKIDGEVVSADSMQVYKYMDIGTAKPEAAEMQGVPHYMIDVVPPWENYSVALYVKAAVSCVDDILSRGKQPIVVGGSGLYVDSLIRGRTFVSHGGIPLRQTLETRYDRIGGKAMLEELRKRDEAGAALLHENDKKRIIRAFEVLESSGKPLSEHDIEEKALPARYDALKIALTFSDRAVLYERIRSRVDTMLCAGLVDEVASLLERGIPGNCTAMQAIGYKELAAAIIDDSGMDAAVDKIKKESTRYAKRQLTWLRRDKSVHWIMWDTAPDIESGVANIMKLLCEYLESCESKPQ